MALSDHYFQFPLRAIRTKFEFDKATEADINQTANGIINWCIYDQATKYEGSDEQIRITSSFAAECGCKENPRNEYVRPMLWACGTLGLPCPKYSYSEFEWAEKKTKEINSRTGGSMRTRLRADILHDAKQGALTFRQFAVLCAVYAGIGFSDKYPASVISYNQLRFMASGYSSEAEFRQCKGGLCDGNQKPLTLKQIRATLDDLEARGFFVSFCPNQRHRWYSNRMGIVQLMDYIVARSAGKDEKKIDKLALFTERQAAAESGQVKGSLRAG